MLTHIRLARIAAVCTFAMFSVLAGAQIHGVAPSVTSFGFGGSNNPTPGVAASVTSVGPNGFACCSGPFISPFFVPSRGFRFDGDGARFHGRRSHDHMRFPVGVFTPAYVPYAVPYPVAYDEGDSGDYDAIGAGSAQTHRNLTYDGDTWRRDSVDLRQKLAKTADRETAKEPPAREVALAPVPDSAGPVTAQPATVLVYKDGHKGEVQNYAIVGDTLFDFSGNLSHKILLADLDLTATQKANDDRGVEFQMPAPARQGQ